MHRIHLRGPWKVQSPSVSSDNWRRSLRSFHAPSPLSSPADQGGPIQVLFCIVGKSTLLPSTCLLNGTIAPWLQTDFSGDAPDQQIRKTDFTAILLPNNQVELVWDQAVDAAYPYETYRPGPDTPWHFDSWLDIVDDR